MSYPFRPTIKKFTYDEILKFTQRVLSNLPDGRTGSNIVYTMADAGLGAFSVFFTQSPSFLDFQRTMELAKGISNAQTLFGMLKIPCDNQIRNLLDGVPPSALFELFAGILDGLKKYGYLEAHRAINETLLVAMDGTQYFSSNEIHCKNCTVKHHKTDLNNAPSKMGLQPREHAGFSQNWTFFPQNPANPGPKIRDFRHLFFLASWYRK